MLSVLRISITLFSLVICLFSQRAFTEKIVSQDKYDAAIYALNNGDCKKAIVLLREFEDESKEFLSENRQIDFLIKKQIDRCKQTRETETHIKGK